MTDSASRKAREIIFHRIDDDWRKDVRRVVDVARLEEEIADAIREAEIWYPPDNVVRMK